MPWRWRKWLKANPKVAWVNYAGLEDNACYALHKKYCPKGAGSVFTFGLKGGYEAGMKLVNSVKLFSHLANIGDTRSLIIHPASTTHRQLSDEDRAKAGAGNDVVRLSHRHRGCGRHHRRSGTGDGVTQARQVLECPIVLRLGGTGEIRRHCSPFIWVPRNRREARPVAIHVKRSRAGSSFPIAAKG